MGRSYGYGDGRARTGFQGVRGRDSRECAGRLLAGASILLVLGALQIAATPAAAAASPARAGAAPTATEGATAATGSARASFPDLWLELLAAVGDGETKQARQHVHRLDIEHGENARQSCVMCRWAGGAA